MAITSAVLRYRRLQTEAPEWSLLRARNASLILGVIGDYFATDQRRLPAADVIAALRS